MTPLTRLEGWEARLPPVIEASRLQTYALGVHDCLIFTCACIEALTGVDFWPRFAGYRSKLSAYRVIRAIAPTLAEAVTVVLGQPPIMPALARRGDVALYRDAEDHLGVCIGAEVAVLEPGGLAFVSLLHRGVILAWRIG